MTTNIALIFFSVDGFPKTLVLKGYERHYYQDGTLVVMAGDQEAHIAQSNLIALNIRRNVDEDEFNKYRQDDEEDEQPLLN